MNTQDLSDNRDRIIRKIKFQVTKATNDNIKAVMVKMVAMLPEFKDAKATMANIDKLTTKAITNYLKYSHSYTQEQSEAVDTAYQAKQRESIQSSLK